MTYNYSKLLGAMKERGMTQTTIAEYTGIDSSTLNKKLNNKSQFKQDEMQAILNTLEIPLSDVVTYFFTH